MWREAAELLHVKCFYTKHTQIISTRNLHCIRRSEVIGGFPVPLLEIIIAEIQCSYAVLFQKPINLYSNSYPGPTVVTITGTCISYRS